MSHRRSTRADTIRFQLALCRTAAVVALVLLAAPAFAVTTNVSVAGVPPDQVQGVTLVLSGGATVQAERADDDQTGTAVWVVDTPEAIPPGSTVDVYMEIVGGHTGHRDREQRLPKQGARPVPRLERPERREQVPLERVRSRSIRPDVAVTSERRSVMRGSPPSTPCTSRSQHHSPGTNTIRFGLGLGRTAAVVALVLLAAPAFAVTTNISVTGVPPDQVQSVTLTVLGGSTVQAERGDDDQTAGAVWVVDTPEAIPLGTDVAVNVRLVNGQTLFDYTTVRLDGAIAVDVEVLYTEALQSANASDATVAESLIVQTAPGNVIKFIPNFTPPLPGVDTWAYIRYQLREMGLLDEQPSTAGPASAENSQGASTVTAAWRIGPRWSLAGVQFRYVADLAPMDMSGGMTYQQQVADALQAIPSPSTSGSVTQDSTQWCHYGSGEGHPLGLGRWGDFGGLSLDSLRLEVNTEDGQDGDAWQFLNDWVRGPQRDQAGLGVHGYSSSGAPPPPVSPIRQRINDMHIEMAEEALQEEHDQDPVQGVADENGTFSADLGWTLRFLRGGWGQGSGGDTQGNAGAG